MRRWLLVLALLLGVLPASAEQQQLTGSYAVIDLPEGFEESTQFTGAIWQEGYASILVSELPAEAYAPVAEGVLADPMALAGQGIALEIVRETEQGPHKGIIGHGRQRVGTQPFDKWALLVGAPHVTLLVTAQMPSVLATDARKETVETALASIRVAETRSDPRAALPFTFVETERFRFLRALSGSAVLLTDPDAEGEAGAKPLFVIGSSLSNDCTAWEKDPQAFAKLALESLRQVENPLIATTFAGPIGDDQGLVTEATGTMGGTEVIVVQTLRFRDCAYLRTVGIGPAANAALLRAEFATLAAKAGWKPEADEPAPAAGPDPNRSKTRE